MKAADVRALCEALIERRIPIWIDGGWAVDALLGAETRTHDDVDIVIEERNLPMLMDYFHSNGYKSVQRDDECAWNFVVGDKAGRIIDVHVISHFDSLGNGIYGPMENGKMYAAGSLTGQGMVEGYPVRCTSAEELVNSRVGYDLREKDHHDVLALCERFGIPRPKDFPHSSSPKPVNDRRPI